MANTFEEFLKLELDINPEEVDEFKQETPKMYKLAQALFVHFEKELAALRSDIEDMDAGLHQRIDFLEGIDY